MALSVSQTSFVGGEWASSLQSRSDLAKYSTAVKKMRNAFMHPHGPVSNRGGLEFIGEIFEHSVKSRLIPFQLSATSSFLLEFSGAGIMRVWQNGAKVIETASLHIIDATFKWTASAHGTGEYYLEKAAGGQPVPITYETPYSVSKYTGTYPSNVFSNSLTVGALGSLAVEQFGFGDNDSLGYATIYVRITGNVDPDSLGQGNLQTRRFVNLLHNHVTAQLPDIKYVQKANVMYLVSKHYAP